jgi:hypothetical protein
MADLNGSAIERDPRLESAVCRHLFQSPLHGGSLDIQGFAVVAVFEEFADVAVDIARTDRVPRPVFPVRVRFAKGLGAGVVGLANPTAQVMDVDDVSALLRVGEVTNAAAPVEGHTDLDEAVVQVGHLVGLVIGGHRSDAEANPQHRQRQPKSGMEPAGDEGTVFWRITAHCSSSSPADNDPDRPKKQASGGVPES